MNGGLLDPEPIKWPPTFVHKTICQFTTNLKENKKINLFDFTSLFSLHLESKFLLLIRSFLNMKFIHFHFTSIILTQRGWSSSQWTEWGTAFSRCFWEGIEHQAYPRLIYWFSHISFLILHQFFKPWCNFFKLSMFSMFCVPLLIWVKKYEEGREIGGRQRNSACHVSLPFSLFWPCSLYRRTKTTFIMSFPLITTQFNNPYLFWNFRTKDLLG